jgi:hypothetical protein
VYRRATKSKFTGSDFVDMMISKVLRDLPFSGKQPLKSADDKNIRISKNKIKNRDVLNEIKKPEKIRQCDLNQASESWNM